jgi:hypothetical protein
MYKTAGFADIVRNIGEVFDYQQASYVATVQQRAKRFRT